MKIESLPAGWVRRYPVRIVVKALTDDMKEWYTLYGGKVLTGNRYPMVKMGNGSPSYQLQDGSNNILLHFDQEDATLAFMFILKFSNDIINHNMKEYEDAK